MSEEKAREANRLASWANKVFPVEANRALALFFTSKKLKAAQRGRPTRNDGGHVSRVPDGKIDVHEGVEVVHRRPFDAAKPVEIPSHFLISQAFQNELVDRPSWLPFDESSLLREKFAPAEVSLHRHFRDGMKELNLLLYRSTNLAARRLAGLGSGSFALGLGCLDFGRSGHGTTPCWPVPSGGLPSLTYPKN